MESRGMLRRNNSFYGLETNKMRKATRNIMMVPMVGNIACGTPILAEENIESYLTISGDFLGQGEFFALRAQGDSMINVGINDGDYVVIRKQSFADEGQIVVAMVNNCDCTLKRYFIDRQKKKVRLHPENDEMEDMYYKEVAIQGVAIKVIKNID
jgi:repressor LexA